MNSPTSTLDRLTLPEGETSFNDLEGIVTIAFEPIKIFLDMLYDNGTDAEKIAVIGSALYEKAYAHIKEALAIIDRDLGTVAFDQAAFRNSKHIPCGKLLSCKLRQPNPARQEEKTSA